MTAADAAAILKEFIAPDLARGPLTMNRLMDGVAKRTKGKQVARLWNSVAKEVQLERERAFCTPHEERTPHDIGIITDIVRAVSCFSHLTDATVTGIAAKLEYLEMDANETVFRAGDEGNSIYVILSGSVNVLLPDPKSAQEAVINTMYSGSSFGELGFITDDGKRTATVVTREDSQLLVLGGDDYRALLKEEFERETLDKYHFLMELPGFATLPMRAVLGLAYVLDRKTCVKDSVVALQDTDCDCITYIVRGRCRIVHELEPDVIKEFMRRHRATPSNTNPTSYSHSGSGGIRGPRVSVSTSEACGPYHPGSPLSPLSDHAASVNTTPDAMSPTRSGSPCGKGVVFKPSSGALPPIKTSMSNMARGGGEGDAAAVRSCPVSPVYQTSRMGQTQGSERMSPAPTGGIRGEPRRSMGGAGPLSPPSQKAGGGGRYASPTAGMRSMSPTPNGVDGLGSRCASPTFEDRSFSPVFSGPILPESGPVIVDVYMMGPGDHFGEHEVLHRRRHFGSVIAITTMHTLVLSKWDFLRRLDKRVIELISAHALQFPTDEELLMELANNQKWEAYKEDLVTTIVNDHSQSRSASRNR